MKRRTCFACKVNKQLKHFYRSNIKYYQRECKSCNSGRKARWHKTSAGKRSSANTKLKARFGISLAEYEERVLDAGGKCQICFNTKSAKGHRLAYDHDHKSGKFRGILCKACNVGLGNFKDSPLLLKAALKYIQK